MSLRHLNKSLGCVLGEYLSTSQVVIIIVLNEMNFSKNEPL